MGEKYEMTPDKDPGLWFCSLPIVAAAVAKFDAVSTKVLLAIAGTALTLLCTWGFLATQSYLKEIKDDVRSMRVEFRDDLGRIHTVNVDQDKCIARIEQQQRDLERIITPHILNGNGKPRNGGGELGDK